ncbi:MAG: hypothetical protein AAFV54_08420 [Pseudomonadota bacterium]
MVDEKSQFSVRDNRPWAQIGFDLEGIVGALAAWLVGLLLGAIWGPLFWVGAAAAVIILLATRKQERTAPDAANLVTAPCDGVVQSVMLGPPPPELRLPATDHLRVRVASSPVSPNTVHAPITGELKSIIQEEPNPSVMLATAPDLPGLAVAHLSFASMGEAVGLTIATGGFGPRLEVIGDSGDAVRTGRVVAKRRLGGWCDIYLRPEARLLVREGQTLIGSETVLCRLSVDAGELADEPEEAAVVEPVETEDKVSVDTESSEEPVVDETPARTQTTEEEEELTEEEISEMFDKLKQKADEASQ